METSTRNRAVRLAVLAVGAAAAVYLGRGLPHDQTVHYVLGDGAPRVEEIDARWQQASERARAGKTASDDDVAREATFRYARGQAPRVVTHEPRLADGDYDVEIEIGTARDRAVITRRVSVSNGGSTSIDLAQAVPR